MEVREEAMGMRRNNNYKQSEQREERRERKRREERQSVRVRIKGKRWMKNIKPKSYWTVE